MGILNKICIKRILKDRKDFMKHPLHNIYIHWNEENMCIAKVVIIGTDDTPFENGFFFFDDIAL